ncbi:hypothetical protein [Lactobacillus helveticus]|uniref:ABC transporter n=1 Tax=Lactobacillus helveticus CIRM-BIA 104 TaxID=1226333 RepID=U6FEQ3_LACHE|nr:hypothetical protein [Lactobacillus helveticus]AKG67196.1 ABC transporter [Lactobacillus helveticus]AUJ27987.1 ABC transporter [Lactobacillus helveticus]EEW67196.1 hypothetical protein HMPREF0518_1844 [Lactobacillus helveticus DSM 20075 = CGMCC 1.1877]KGL03714.1 ABC transporter [Lactobacillus helveticus]KGL05377.1 ABC transporter [Lactobacillus helveticus]
MSKKILTLIFLIATVLNLSACSQNSAQHNKNVDNNTQRQVSKKLTANNLTKTSQASAITMYAAMNYKGKWQDAYKQATKKHLSISIKSGTGFSQIFKGQGYIYQISGNGKEQNTFYTLKKNKVSFFNHKKKIATVSLSSILAYLNDHQKFEEVKKLATNTVVGARITSDKYGVKGDAGLAFIPKKLRGTWHNRRGKKLVITAHTIDGEEIHRISASSVTTASFQQTKHWARARIENINGVNCYHVQSLGAQNFGLLYTLQKNGRNLAVVTYSVDTGDFLNSYWKSTAIAKNNVNAEFKSLK